MVMTTKTALVTGASAGIGFELSRVFAEHGFNLILVARREEKLKIVADQLTAQHGIKVTLIKQDLMHPGAALELFNKVQASSLKVDVLVNNAGRGQYASFIDTDLAANEATLQLNVTTLTSLTRLFAKDMVDQGTGYILNIASIAAFVPGPMMAVYHATKAYVLSLSEALNNELSGTGVTVTTSCPGPTESEFLVLAGADKLANLKYTKFMTARKVAEQAYEATVQRQSVVVHGGVNKAIVFLPRILPRKWITKMIQKMMR